MMPQLDQVSSNVYSIQAFSGHGVALTHMMARITAEMIEGDSQRFDIFSQMNKESVVSNSVKV